jgi:4-hydroxybenzoate polyprenyltransferase
VTETSARSPLGDVGRFLEIQNLGLNLTFALAFLFVAARGWPPLVPFVLAVLAFVAARNAGHSFNRWSDRVQDRANPRTQARALVTGRFSERFALALTAGNAAVLFGAAYLLNPLALLLAPVALALVLGYSVTKRLGWGTTLFLGLVEAITPVAAFVAIRAALPIEGWIAAAGVFLWGSAFETVHSLGDLASDRQLGQPSLPARFGETGAVRAVALFHGLALAGFVGFGLLAGLGYAFALALAAIAIATTILDVRLWQKREASRRLFRWHMLLGAVFLVGVAVGVFFPALLT